MRVLVVGPITPDFDSGYNAAIVRAFEQHGCLVHLSEFYVATPPGFGNRLLIDGGLLIGQRRYYEKYVFDFNSALRATYNKFSPDIVFVIRGSKVLSETLEGMTDATRILWCQDKVIRCDLSRHQLECFDRVFVFEESDIVNIKDQFGIVAKFLPMAYDPSVYFSQPSVNKDIDLFFVGSFYPERRELLEKLAASLSHRRILFYGRNVRYREPTTWVRYIYYKARFKSVFINKSIDAHEINSLYARSKICLNLHHAQSSGGCNPRVFEILGSGGFQLVDENRFVEAHFPNVIVTFTDHIDLLSKIEQYIPDRVARNRLSSQGQEIASSLHTFSHRIGDVLADVSSRS